MGDRRPLRSPSRVHLLLVLGVAGLLLGYVWQHIEGIRLGYRLERLRGEISRLRNTVVQQRARLTSLTALERVDTFAKGTLGLRLPRPEEIMSIPLDPPGEISLQGAALPSQAQEPPSSLRRWP